MSKISERDFNSSTNGADAEDVRRLTREVEPLKHALKPWLPNDGSVLDKSLRRILTTAQNARIATLCEMESLGGHVNTESQGPGAVLEIHLAGIAFANEQMARLERLTTLQGLDLASTQITDAGLVHLQG